MSSLILPQRIFCDEAGFTGNRMLDAQQPLFTYASVAMHAHDAQDLVEALRRDFRMQADELKGSRLMRSSRGRDAVFAALQRMRERYLVTAYDKKVSLAGKFFEYIFEPVLARNNRLFYENDFHKFIANLVYVNFICSEAAMVDIVTQFERFMRSLDPADAPIIFDTSTGDVDIHPSLTDIANFIDGYRDIILSEIESLRACPGVANWVLDLTTAALWSHLAHWGERHAILDVLCDDSKPLAAIVPIFDNMVNRPDQVQIRLGVKVRPLTFNLSKPAELGASSDHHGLQLADLASSAFMQALKRNGEGEDWPSRFLYEIAPHVHEDCILPDFDYVDLSRPASAVNALVLCELGARALDRRDPLEGMETWYRVGHETVQGYLDGSCTEDNA